MFMVGRLTLTLTELCALEFFLGTLRVDIEGWLAGLGMQNRQAFIGGRKTSSVVGLTGWEKCWV